MSLEAALAANTAALEANTAALLGGSPAKAAAKPAGEAPAKAAKKSETTVDDLVDKFGSYLSTGSKAAKEKAKTVVGAIVEKFDAERISKLDPEHFDEALAILAQYQDGEDPLDCLGEEEEGGGLM